MRLINSSTGEERTFSTSEDGKYSFAHVEVGTYAVKADAAGFATAQLQDITVQQGEQCRGDVIMNLAFAVLGGDIATPVFTLRRLYDNSELVVVARASKSIRVNAEGEAKLMKSSLQISSTDKGAQGARTIDLYSGVR